MACRQQGIQCAINRVTRPAEGWCIEVVANLGTFFAGADVSQQLLADGVLVGLLSVAHRLEGFQVALARFVQHFAPQVMVSGVKLAVKANGG